MSTPIATAVVCRPAIAYFPQYDALYPGLLSGELDLRGVAAELRDSVNALSPEDKLRIETGGSSEDRLLAKALRLVESAADLELAEHPDATLVKELLTEADSILRRAERMWTDNSAVHEALLRTGMGLGLGIDILQQRLFAAARVSPSVGTAKAAVAAFGVHGGGDVRTALNALRLLCGDQPVNHPSRGAVLELALDTFDAGEGLAPLHRAVLEQFELAANAEVCTPDDLIRLADAAYVARSVPFDGGAQFREALEIKLDMRYTGLWSAELDTCPWKPEGVVVPDSAPAKKSGLGSLFRR